MRSLEQLRHAAETPAKETFFDTLISELPENSHLDAMDHEKGAIFESPVPLVWVAFVVLSLALGFALA